MTGKTTLRLCAMLAALMLVFTALAAAAETADTTEPNDEYAVRLEQARLKYNSKTVNVYRKGWGYVQNNKINVCFYRSAGEQYYAINIRESLKITDEAEMEAILEVITQFETYDEEIYGDIAFMKAQWIAHNLAYELATGSEETQRIIAAVSGESAKSVAKSAKELDLSPIPDMDDREKALIEKIQVLFLLQEKEPEDQ